MCPIYIHYRDIYRWRSASQVQRSYSQNIPGRTRNFPITIVSGLQLRWAPLTQAVFFASTLLFTHLRDVPYFKDGLRLIFGRPAEGPSVLRSPFALMLVLSHLRVSSVACPKSSEGWHYLRSALAPAHVRSGLRAPSATGPKVVSPTVAPQSLGSIFRKGVASTLWASKRHPSGWVPRR